jgi:hypothetical protein
LIQVDLPACRLGPLADDEREALLGSPVPTTAVAALAPSPACHFGAAALGAVATLVIAAAAGVLYALGWLSMLLAILGGLALACRQPAFALVSIFLAILIRP